VKLANVRKSMDGDSSVLRTNVISGLTFSSVWFVGEHCEFWMVSARIALFLNLENHLETRVLHHFCSTKAT
jgi:hypothetical protein